MYIYKIKHRKGKIIFMFKKIIAAALAALTLTVAGSTAFAASNEGWVNAKDNPNSYYHYCTPGSCFHAVETTYLGMSACGRWGFVYSPSKDHKDSYKYISVTTYGYNEDTRSHYVKKTVNNSGVKSEIISPTAYIDGKVSKVVYNGQVFRTAEKIWNFEKISYWFF